jgi:hypothetical protein
MELAGADMCSKCRKKGAGMRYCSNCKEAHYCGHACQRADWKSHKNKCASPESVADLGFRIDF